MEQISSDIKQNYDAGVEDLAKNLRLTITKFIEKYRFAEGEEIDIDSVDDSLAILKSTLWSACPNQIKQV